MKKTKLTDWSCHFVYNYLVVLEAIKDKYDVCLFEEYIFYDKVIITSKYNDYSLVELTILLKRCVLIN